jgi:hypothetical protein
MVRGILSEWVGVSDEGGPLYYGEYFGLSTDTKPTDGIVTGSKFTEVDTGKVYLFDEEADADKAWVEQGADNGAE